MNGWNEAERETLRATIADRQPFLDFLFSRTNADGSQAAVSRERRADVQPVLPLHRLSRHRRRTHGAEKPAACDAQHAIPHNPNQNHLLAALPTAEFERLARQLNLVPMPLGQVLYEPGEQLQHAYFPTTAIVSLHYVMESGASAETAGVGNEGVVGIALFMGGDTTPSSAVVKTAGHAYRLERRLLKQEFDRAGLMQRLLLRYTQALITQMTQTAACNRHHSVEQQLCRWLLSTLDRVPSR